MRFVKLSATMSGINDVKEIVKVAKNEAQFKRHTILFMDEIHRYENYTYIFIFIEPTPTHYLPTQTCICKVFYILGLTNYSRILSCLM